MSFVSSKGNILCKLINMEPYKIFAIINRAINCKKNIHWNLFPHFGTVLAYHWKNQCLSWYPNKNNHFPVGDVVFITTDFLFYCFHMSHNDKILIIKHVFIAV